MKINTPTKWEAFRAIVGLPGHIRVKDVPGQLDNTELARFFFSSPRRGEDVTTEQELAEFGCPTPRRHNHAEI